MKKSGIDDEAIQSGENLLLTFTNIRNEAGKGNDIFNQATKATLDMSVALGKDMKSSRDPARQGAQRSDQGHDGAARVWASPSPTGRRRLIKALVEPGDTMGAQKIILKELNKEFGGSAEAAGKTLPGQLNILKQQFSNVAGEDRGQAHPGVQGDRGLGARQLADDRGRLQGRVRRDRVGVRAHPEACVRGDPGRRQVRRSTT